MKKKENRMWEGFKILCSKLKNAYLKLANSNYVQNMKAEQERGGDSDTYMPTEITSALEEETQVYSGIPKTIKKKKENTQTQKDPFATDFSSIEKIDF